LDQETPFNGRHYQPEIILLCVRGYLRYSPSYRDLKEMITGRGLQIDHTTIYRWVQCNAPEFEKHVRSQLKPTNDSWRVNETSIKVRDDGMYLYYAANSARQHRCDLERERRYWATRRMPA
jgi:transposase-like protein